MRVVLRRAFEIDIGESVRHQHRPRPFRSAQRVAYSCAMLRDFSRDARVASPLFYERIPRVYVRHWFC
jgi:hypothetical protein